MVRKNNLNAIFRNFPCKTFQKFGDAVKVAEILPEGCRCVWRVTYQPGDTPYRVTRVPEQVARYNEPDSCAVLIWQDGVTLEPQDEPKTPLKKLPPSLRDSAKACSTYKDGTFERCVENLKGEGYDVSGLLAEIKESPPADITNEPAITPLPQIPLPQGARYSVPAKDGPEPTDLMRVAAALVRDFGIDGATAVTIVKGLGKK
jgi:hypothetical protein